MANRKLNYRFHDPNKSTQTANYILKVFVEANKEKVEEEIRKVTETSANASEYAVEHSA